MNFIQSQWSYDPFVRVVDTDEKLAANMPTRNTSTVRKKVGSTGTLSTGALLTTQSTVALSTGAIYIVWNTFHNILRQQILSIRQIASLAVHLFNPTTIRGTPPDVAHNHFRQHMNEEVTEIFMTLWDIERGQEDLVSMQKSQIRIPDWSTVAALLALAKGHFAQDSVLFQLATDIALLNPAANSLAKALVADGLANASAQNHLLRDLEAVKLAHEIVSNSANTSRVRDFISKATYSSPLPDCVFVEKIWGLSSNPSFGEIIPCSEYAAVNLVFALQLTIDEFDNQDECKLMNSHKKAEELLSKVVTLRNEHSRHNNCVPFRILDLCSYLRQTVQIKHLKGEYQGWLFQLKFCVFATGYEVKFVFREDCDQEETDWLRIYDLKIST